MNVAAGGVHVTGSPASQCIWCPQSGLFTSALAPKPAWREFVRFTDGS